MKALTTCTNLNSKPGKKFIKSLPFILKIAITVQIQVEIRTDSGFELNIRKYIYLRKDKILGSLYGAYLKFQDNRRTISYS